MKVLLATLLMLAFAGQAQNLTLKIVPVQLGPLAPRFQARSGSLARRATLLTAAAPGAHKVSGRNAGEVAVCARQLGPLGRDHEFPGTTSE